MAALRLFALFVALILAIAGVEAKLKPGECEVCIHSLTKFQKGMSKEEKASVDSIEEALKSWCKAHPHGAKEERLCYYIGGSEHSATTMLREISKPMKDGIPPERICERLKPKNAAICELQFEKEIDWEQIPKMKIKDLKKILANWGADCPGCVEKPDYVKRVQELRKTRDEL